MNILIRGSRSISDPALVAQAVEKSDITPPRVVSGGARGVDTLARFDARSRGIEFTEYVADADKHGKRARYIRNCAMVAAVDAVIAVGKGKSPGTKHSIDHATSRGTRRLCSRREEKLSGGQTPEARTTRFGT